MLLFGFGKHNEVTFFILYLLCITLARGQRTVILYM